MFQLELEPGSFQDVEDDLPECVEENGSKSASLHFPREIDPNMGKEELGVGTESQCRTQSLEEVSVC